MSTTPHEERGTGDEQDWADRSDDGPRRSPQEAATEPDIGTAGAFPALANDTLPEDPDVPTSVDPGDPRRGAVGDETDPTAGFEVDPTRSSDD